MPKKITVSGTISLSNGLRIVAMESDPEAFIKQLRKLMKIKKLDYDDLSLVSVL